MNTDIKNRVPKLILCFVLMLSLFVTPVLAADNASMPNATLCLNTPEATATMYYYDQLTDRQKQLYHTICDFLTSHEREDASLYLIDSGYFTAEELEDAWDGTTLKEDFKAAMLAVYYERSDFWWVEWYSNPVKLTGSKPDTLKIQSDTTHSTLRNINRGEIKSMTESLNSVVHAIFVGAKDCATDVAKVRYAHDEVCKMLEYDYEKDKNTLWSAWAAIDGDAVCAGYARLMALCLDKLGIPNILVEGVNDDGEGHIWNEVCINDHWYIVDATWDDVAYSLTARHTYCLIGADTEHNAFVRKNWLSYPTL